VYLLEASIKYFIYVESSVYLLEAYIKYFIYGILGNTFASMFIFPEKVFLKLHAYLYISKMSS